MCLYCFENFSLNIEGRQLSAQGASLPLGRRAFDVLAADAAGEIRRRTDTTTILATSREPLRTAHEQTRQLPPLTFPPAGLDIEPSSYAALELFISLASLVDDRHEFDDPQALAAAADIVRRLDGIPLAIHFAAARTLDMDLLRLRRSFGGPLYDIAA
jgi:predicted ATPase